MKLVPLEDIRSRWLFSQCLPEVFQDSPMISEFYAEGNDERIANMNTITEKKWTELEQTENIAYFKADLCLYSPESYSLEEKRGICNGMAASSKAILDAMREDFQSYPPELRSKLLAMICEAESEKADGGGTSSSARKTCSIRSSKQSNHMKRAHLPNCCWWTASY